MGTLNEKVQTYYESQIEKINPRTGFQAQIKIQHETGDTKWLSLNDESAKVLVKWLTDNFNI